MRVPGSREMTLHAHTENKQQISLLQCLCLLSLQEELIEVSTKKGEVLFCSYLRHGIHRGENLAAVFLFLSSSFFLQAPSAIPSTDA